MKKREFAALYQAALKRLDKIPDWEQDRLIIRMRNHMVVREPKDATDFLRLSKYQQWVIVKSRIINNKAPFVDYKPELTGVF